MTTTVSHPTSSATEKFGPGPLQTPAAKIWSVLLRIVVAQVIMLAGYGPMLLISQLPGMDATADGRAGNWGLALLKLTGPMLSVPLTALALLWLATRFLDRRPFRVTGIRVDRRTLPALLLGVGVSLAVVVPASVLLGRLGLVPVYPDNTTAPLWVVVVNILMMGFVMQGIPEEFVWRGWLTQSVGGSQQRQALIAATFFGLAHIVSNGGHASWWEGAIYVLDAAAFGYAAAALYFATGSLWGAVGIHGGLHLANYLAQTLGGGEGWTLNLVQITLYLLIGAAVMRRLPERPTVNS
ncbi:MAG: type II CAAX endopeptidase family protein [Propionicimonas sp.]